MDQPAPYDPRTVVGVSAVAIQDQRRSDRTEGGVSFEQPGTTRGLEMVGREAPISDDLARAISSLDPYEAAFQVAAARHAAIAPSPGVLTLIRLAEKRAKTRLLSDELYPEELETFDPDMLDMDDTDLVLAAQLCCVKQSGATFPAHECAVRLLLFLGAALRPEDYGKSVAHHAVPSLRSILGQDIVEDEETALPYMGALAVSYLVMAMAKPFVDRVTAAANQMAGNLQADLRIKDTHLNATLFAEIYRKYVMRFSLKGMMAMIINRRFEGSSWFTAYAARYGAGTSHLSMITSLLYYFGDCPLLKHIPTSELTAFMEAVQAVENDPLLLFPAADDADLDLDRYRTSAMPSLVILAYTVLTAAGDENWKKFQNIPGVRTIASVPVNAFISAANTWTRKRVAGKGVDSIISQASWDGFSFTAGEARALGKFIQPPGKIKSVFQRPT